MDGMAYDNGPVDHSQMDHGQMDHSQMDHGEMDHSKMDHSQMNQGEMDHSSMGGMMMMMYFHFSSHSTILFSFWKTTSWEGMLGSCIAVFFIAALYEGLKVAREILLQRFIVSARQRTLPVPTTDNVIFSDTNTSISARMLSLSHFVQSALHVAQIVVSYLLMLIFMTYNLWLCIAVALGAGVGYFAFCWRRAVIVDVNEHCH